MISEELLQTLQLILQQSGNISYSLSYIGQVSGGSINRCYQIKSHDKSFFIKINNREEFPGMFAAEAEGLKLIAATDTLKTPKIVAVGAEQNEQFLISSFIEKGSNTKNAFQLLGVRLAQMHRTSCSYFGLDHNNYMGSLTQNNSSCTNWTDFFVTRRLEPQVKMAFEFDLLSKAECVTFNRLFTNLVNLFPVEKPALVHGDLWSGNVMIDLEGNPVLIDPAVAFANREVDIAMTRLFGGFTEEFYDAYNEEYPLQKDFNARIDLWNLYPLLVHLNLFGGGYRQQVLSAVGKYI